MTTYRITGGGGLLPKGTHFIALPGPVAEGQFMLFRLCGVLQIGLWIEDFNGHDYIMQVHRAIKITTDINAPDSNLKIVGTIVLTEAPPREITNLTTSEYVTALLNLREAKG